MKRQGDLARLGSAVQQYAMGIPYKNKGSWAFEQADRQAPFQECFSQEKAAHLSQLQPAPVYIDMISAPAASQLTDIALRRSFCLCCSQRISLLHRAAAKVNCCNSVVL